MDTVDVVIPTFGDFDKWFDLSQRAARSVYDPPGVKVQLVEGHTTSSLCEARNAGARGSKADWLIFLDADDELDSYYIEAMLAGTGDVRWPSTLGVVNGVEDDEPVLLQPRPSLIISNHCVIGSMIRRSFFEEVGGFRDFPILEDWDLFIRLALAGADFQPCPEAIYRVHVQEVSRNTDLGLHGRVYRQIQDEHQEAWYRKFGRR